MPYPSTQRRRPRGRSFGQRNQQNSGRGGRSKQAINPERFVNNSVTLTDAVVYTPRHKFSTFAFDPRIHKAIMAKGYTTPTAIQDQAIAHVLAGRDLVGIANTGTGKTASFILPIINRLINNGQKMALIVTPTRELASQIDDEFKSFSGGLGLRSVVCVGGLREGPQIKGLKAEPNVVIGTPGRLKDFITNRHLKLSNCLTFVLDEADRMLDMGFIHDMKFIMRHLPEERQSLCFSATITPEIQKIIDDLLDEEAVTVSVRTRETAEHIEQKVIKAADSTEKLAHMVRLFSTPEYSKVLVFTDTKHGAQRLADKLAKRGITSIAIHGNKSQNQRQRALSAFKGSGVQVMVATDVAARGLDVPAVSHVINYDAPTAYTDYVHRIGRTGRAGQKGVALTFVPA